MKLNYQIREYGVISNGCLGSPYSAGSIEIENDSFISLTEFIEENSDDPDFENAFQIFQKKGRRHIRVKNYVGVLETKEGVSIEILPKIYNGKNDISDSMAKEIFLKLLKSLLN